MEDKMTPEDIKMLRDYKARLFDLYWEKFGFFYIHVLPHPNLEIGKRGLVGKEKEQGVVLAFGSSACKDLSTQPDYLFAELQFGHKWEKLFIPWDCLYRIFDKSQNSITQLHVLTDAEIDYQKSSPQTETKSEGHKVIEVDFTKKK
jgi:hypothetical protein